MTGTGDTQDGEAMSGTGDTRDGKAITGTDDTPDDKARSGAGDTTEDNGNWIGSMPDSSTDDNNYRGDNKEGA